MTTITLSATELANTVTGFATIFTGIFTYLFTVLTKPVQPNRWKLAYFTIFLTGIPTVWYHGFGESYALSLLDTGSNLFVGWAILSALLLDFYTKEKRKLFYWIITVWNITGTLTMVYEMMVHHRLFRLFGFFPGELFLVVDAFAILIFFFLNADKISFHAKPLLKVCAAVFAVGLLLATAEGHKVGWNILSFHALWHIVGAFGFITLWLFNFIRFYDMQYSNK
ncbi:MAG: hypothetical protein K1X55_14990 [Chitinophagales bacterium]|nr:hypothetical protein [Chitinophagales bacterium]